MPKYYEYKVLAERIGDKVRHIVPPFELPDTFFAGMVRGSDALSKSFVDNEVITRYLSDERCSIILFENPPFAETTSMEHQKKKAGKTSSISTYAIKLGIRSSGTTKTAFRRRFVGEVILRRSWRLSHAEMSDSFVE